MKKMLSLLLVLCLAVSCFAAVVSASEEEEAYVVVMLDDEEVVCDAEPFIENDRTMVGLRGIFEQMGAEVIWNEEEQSVVIAGESREVKLFIGDKNVTVKNGEESKNYEMDVVPVVKKDRTYVPLRFVAETFDCVVDYYVSGDGTEVAVIYTPEYNYTNLVDLFEKIYDVTPVVDEKLPVEENTFYYELDDKLFLPMGKDHLIAYQKEVVKNFFCTYAYDDVTGWFGDGGWTNNEYTLTKYNEIIDISVVTDPRVENSNEEAHFVVVDKKLDIVGDPIVKVVYTPSKNTVSAIAPEEETKEEVTEEDNTVQGGSPSSNATKEDASDDTEKTEDIEKDETVTEDTEKVEDTETPVEEEKEETVTDNEETTEENAPENDDNVGSEVVDEEVAPEIKLEENETPIA